jgi:hypothetical protein
MTKFIQIERDLIQVLNASKGRFSDDEEAAVQELIDAGEYGLALQTTVDIYLEGKKPINMIVKKGIEQLALAMQMNLSDSLKKLYQIEGTSGL